MECIELMDVLDGGEVFIPKIPSVKIMDVYQALTGNLNNYTIIGDRIGDKLHEILICPEETRHTIDGGNKFIIYPENPEWHYHKPKGDVCAYGTGYCSNTNQEFLSVEQIKKTLEEKY
jgi:UDP-N-acetylglucosamine 4,6-dehydratase